MTNRATPSSDNVSSSIGRQWINEQLGTDSNMETPRIQVIPIPDLRAVKQETQPVRKAEETFARAAALASGLSEAPIVATTLPDFNLAEMDDESLDIRNESTVRPEIPAVSLPVVGQARAEQLAQGTIPKPLAEEDRNRIKRGYLSTLDRKSEDVDGVCRQINEKFPGDAPCVIMFCSSEENQKVEYTAAQTAVSLLDQIEGRVLLIDSDLDNGNLSLWQHAEKETGICDLYGRQIELNSIIRETSDPRIDFLPVGNISGFKISNSMERLTRTVATLKSNYRLVIVNVGDAHSKAAAIWAQHTSGCYLMVSMEHSSKAVAKSAVTHLESCGARLMGCVVSEVSPPTVGF